MARSVADRSLRSPRTWGPGRPTLTIIVVGSEQLDETLGSLAGQTAPRRRFEIVTADSGSAGLARARGRFCTFLDAGARVAPEYVQRVLARASSRAATVPSLEDASGGDAPDPFELALVAPGVVIPTAVARTSDDESLAAGDDLVRRAHALAQLEQHPVLVPVAPPAGPRRPATVAGLTPLETARAWIEAFARVQAIGESHRQLSRPLLRAKREIATSIGRVIATSPEIRPAVLRDVESRPFTSFSHRAMNMECSQLLVIAYVFPPFLDTSGFVVSRRLKDSEQAYDVVTQDMSGRRPRDERSLELAKRNLGRRMVVRGRITSGHWPDVEQFCRAGMEKIEAREAEAGAYRELYSRSMWAAASVLAAWYKVRHPEVPWTAELSDPLVVRPNGERRENPMPPSEILAEIDKAVQARGFAAWTGDRFFEAVEWMIYALADRIVFTNDNQRELMLSGCPDPELAERARSVSEVQRHPVPDAEFYGLGSPDAALPEGKVRIGYFGNFYTVRGVGDILDPFARLTPGERDKVALLIFTTAVDSTRAAVAEHPAGACATVMPALPYFDFLSMTKQMDWLVLADARTPATFPVNPYLPSKLADYRGSGTPIWGLVEEGSVLSGETLDARSVLGDADAAAEVIRGRILRR